MVAFTPQKTDSQKSKDLLSSSELLVHYNISPVSVGMPLHHPNGPYKPLLGLLGELKTIHPSPSGRLQRWALMLAQYQYELMYRPGPPIANANGLSRLPLPDIPKDPKSPPELLCSLKQIQTAPLATEEINCKRPSSLQSSTSFLYP